MKVIFGRILFVLTFILVAFSLFSQETSNGWDFIYPGDNFTNTALLDLSYLNEDVAGESGFVQLSADGNSFVDGAGNPLRFWCINGGNLARDFSTFQMRKYARFLAKMGVNMIRFHGSINPKGEHSEITDVDTEEADDIWKMVATMKEEGIYSTISPFWAHNGHMGGNVPEEWGIEGYSGNDALWGIMFFNDTLKEAYKKWVEYLYTEKNPYTGIALKDDPAVGIIQVKNEDGLFFWTIQNIKEPLEKIIRQKFNNWLVEKYGSIQNAQTAWGNVTLEDDNTSAGEMDIYIVWYATQEQSGSLDKRLTDQMEFMAEVQHNFYREIYDFYRSIGCKQLINGNNWKTANSARLLDVERWANTSCDVIALNRYYDPGHTGTNSGWRIDPGHYYQGKSVLFQPNKLPINVKQPSGHPAIVTESGWNLPHKYQAEGPFLISAYMSLTGVDGFYWFNPSDWAYDSNPYHTWANLEGGQHPLYRWTISTPGPLAMFPANALLYRRGYLSEGKTIVSERRTLESLWKREIPVITENMGFDPNRDSQVSENEETEVSPLAYLTGKITVEYDAENNSSTIDPELSQLIDFDSKKLKSSTGQLEWDYQNGICVMDAPAAQGICGFVGAQKTFELSGISIETENEYAAVNVVAMDENPITESSRVLVQVGTIYRPSNWSESPATFELNDEMVDGFRIDNTGEMPWKAANTKIKLTLENSRLAKAIVVNAAGYPKEEVDLVKNGNSVQLHLPEDAMYVILESPTHSGNTLQNDYKMKVFPNPGNGDFWIEIAGNDFSGMSLELQNQLGQKIREIKNITGNTIPVQMHNYKGMLLVSLKKQENILATDKVFVIN